MFKPGLVGLILLWGCHTLTEKQNLRYSNSFHFEKFFSRYSTLWLWLKKDPFLYREKNHLISGQKISSMPLRSPIISQVWPGGAGERWVEGKILTWRGHWKVWMFFFLSSWGTGMFQLPTSNWWVIAGFLNESTVSESFFFWTSWERSHISHPSRHLLKMMIFLFPLFLGICDRSAEGICLQITWFNLRPTKCSAEMRTTLDEKTVVLGEILKSTLTYFSTFYEGKQ